MSSINVNPLRFGVFIMIPIGHGNGVHKTLAASLTRRETTGGRVEQTIRTAGTVVAGYPHLS